MEPNGGDRAPADDPADGIDAALAAGGVGTWRWDAETGVVHWDATLEALSGLEPGEFGGDYEAWMDQIHPEEREMVLSLVEGALERRGSYQFEHRTVWPDGSVRWLECRGEVLLDAEGEPCGTVGCALDVTDRKTAELGQAALMAEVEEAAERLRRLQRVVQPLASALTVEDVVSTVMEVLEAPAPSNIRGLWLVPPGDDALVLADHRNLAPESTAVFERMALDSTLPGPVAVRTRQTVISPSQADSVERFPVLEGAPRSAQGFIAVPLVVEDEALGVLAFGYDGVLDDGEVSFLEAAAGHVSQTLKRVRLADDLRRRAGEVAFLSDVTQAAITASDHRVLMRSIAATAVPRLGEVCSIHFVPEPGSRAETVVVHADPTISQERAAQLLDSDGSGPDRVARVLATGRPELVRLDGGGSGSVIAVPISGNERVVGALQVLATGSDRVQTLSDLALAHAVADGIGKALEYRWVTDQHREISTTLQRAFLPPVLPSIPKLDVCAAYVPAGSANVVGGDFYDVFALGDDRWSVVIGDACGTGPDAAAVATITRHTMRAAARHGCDHDTVLDWANQAVKNSDRNLFCTACYATVHAEPNETKATVQLAVAGHPLPVLLTADGRAELLGEPGTLLGIFDGINTSTGQIVLEPGDAILFYTDGVTDLPPPHGLTPQGLLGVFDDLPAGFTAAQVIDHVRADLEARTHQHSRADDVALLVIRNLPVAAETG